MKHFACGDVVPGCTMEFDAVTDGEILALVGAHAAADHEIATVSPELVSAVRAVITTR
jgi:predicted small metal-binding protein